jgi:uncharacterized membrane protein
MNPQYRAMTAKTDREPVLFEATLRPNPPMPPGALRLVLALVASVNLAFGLFFVLRGAWLVTPFMGLDIALLAWAFRASVRASRRSERVVLTPSNLVVERRPSEGPPSALALNPYWVRVEMEDPPEHWSPLTLWSHGKGVRLGMFLPPADRLDLARSLKAALRRARETLPT